MAFSFLSSSCLFVPPVGSDFFVWMMGLLKIPEIFFCIKYKKNAAKLACECFKKPDNLIFESSLRINREGKKYP